MTPSQLKQCGEALYGPHWQSELARQLGVDGRTVRRWVAGDSPIPAGVWADIGALLRTKSAEVADASKMLRAIAKSPATV